MAFTKKLNVRNSAAIIKEVNQMLESGYPKKETYKVVGAKYNVSSKSVQRIMSGQIMDTSKQKMDTSTKTLDTSKQKMDTSTKTLDTSLDTSAKRYTSADIVDNVCKLAKTKDYVAAFDKMKSKVGHIVLSNGTDVLF